MKQHTSTTTPTNHRTTQAVQTPAPSAPGPRSASPATAVAPTNGAPGEEGVPPSAAGGVVVNHGSGSGEILGGMAGFRYGEAAAARVLGLSPVAIGEARKKTGREGTDWALVKNRVAYTETGLVRIVTFLVGPLDGAGVPLPELLNRSLLEELQTPAAEQLTGTVQRFYLNTRLIGVLVQGRTELVNVRVNSNRNFVRGMSVPIKNNGDHWMLARKEPRFPGKW